MGIRDCKVDRLCLMRVDNCSRFGDVRKIEAVLELVRFASEF